MTRSDVAAAVVAVAVAARGLLTLPGSYWQGEEIRLAQALLTYDGSAPLFVGAARFVNFFLRDPFSSLLVLSLAATIGGAILMTRAASELLGSEPAGAAASLALYLSPAMLVFTPLPNADAFDVALVALALLAVARRKWVLVGVALIALGIDRFAAVPRLTVEPLAQLAARFVAHPWGGKFLAIPLLLSVAAGAVVLRRRWPLLVAAGLFIAFCIATGSLTSGVQLVLPTLPLLALFAAAAFVRIPALAVVLSIAYATASIVYVRPILEARREVSPPMAAMSYAERTQPPDAVMLVDSNLESHASLASERIRVAPIRELGQQGAHPAYLVVQGAIPGARTFSWPESDAYGKITPQNYRVVSVYRVDPRYVPREGVYTMESTVADGAWHWLERNAVIDFEHPLDRVQLRLAAAAPVPSVEVSVNGVRSTVARGETNEIVIPPSKRVSFQAQNSWHADGRDLSVQLLSIRRR